MPTSATLRATSSGPRSMRTPSASSVSAPPRQRRRGPVAVLDHRDPAGGHHDRGHRRQVDGVRRRRRRCRPRRRCRCRSRRSAPGGRARASCRRARVTSADVGRFIFIDTPKPAIWAGVAAPVMIWSIAHAACPAASALSRGQAAEDLAARYGAMSAEVTRLIMTNCVHPGGVQQLQSVILLV